MKMKCEYVEIVFGRPLSIEELDTITEWLDENITDDYSLVSCTKEVVDENLSNS